MKYIAILFIFFSILAFSSNILSKCIKGDCINGQGTYKWGDGNKYTGQWKNGKPHGKGKLVSPYGVTYVGDWKDNLLHGKGIITYYNGDKYVGNFKNGKRHGKGILYNKEKKIIKKGVWANDVFVEK